MENLKSVYHQFNGVVKKMTTGNILDTKTVSLNEVLGNGKIYRVPQFQRDYSWHQDNWEDLWNDIEIAFETKHFHYMGSVVLQRISSKEFLIIDGQQRFTTLSILTLAVISTIQELIHNGIEIEENKERINILMLQNIGQKDASSLTYSSKLFLNENNDAFYQNRLLLFKEPINVRKLSDSENLMWNAYQFFKYKISVRFDNNSGADLASFLNDIIGELMIFILITVEDELNAYTVFETLNSRGIELTSTDLLKNYLFSIVTKSQSDLKQVKVQWKKIVDTIGLKEFPVFLRFVFLATSKQISKDYLFKEIKYYVKSDHDVFNLLDKLEKYAYFYIALDSPDDELWNNDKENRNSISILKSFGVTHWKSLLLIAGEKLSVVDYRRLLKTVIVITYRYNVIAKLQTNEMEKIYSQAAINLFNNENPNLQSVLNDLKELYVNDNEFKNYFSIKKFITTNSSDKKLLRYTLYKLESQEKDGSMFDFDIDNGTIEHILPESYPLEWQDAFSEDEFERNIYMLGNLTLLEGSKNNKDASNKVFDDKKKIYSTSKFVLTRNITDPHWTPQNIKHRQAHLAKLACSVWKIEFS